MKILDLSHPLVDGAPGFPGDPPLCIAPHATVATHHFNTSLVSTGTHQGTHLDAMFHFFDQGRTLDRMPLEWFYGPARVLRLPKPPDALITTADLEPHAVHFQRGAKIIVATGWDRWFGRPEYFTDFPSFTLEAARYLAGRGIRLLGMDMPTPGKQWLELHHILLAADTEMVLVEGLAGLAGAPDEFTFAAFPLNLVGRDGSPVRAVAICD